MLVTRFLDRGAAPPQQPAPAPHTAAPAGQAPRASTHPPTGEQDLAAVCDQKVYFPRSPKHAGKAPHPVALFREKMPNTPRAKDNTYYLGVDPSSQAGQTWATESYDKVQLVACVDRVTTGTTIRECRFDDPTPETVTLLDATWRLHVYEVSTGRKLLDKTMPGDDRACPVVAFVGLDRKIYAKISDRTTIASLRDLVTK
ncbi:hypothetical protein [Asanoa siamensis]|uniref:Uncharacterized protein n=1 Tax=Asanoa siamensis TaxID=926357 RepID=A0ABQ4D449_9ACTN|nr:hypothetical protein [Asanoa siamensis]GIF78302.1 hypothetical protein Asi02nite_78200 [Asanoa siamensis]